VCIHKNNGHIPNQFTARTSNIQAAVMCRRLSADADYARLPWKRRIIHLLSGLKVIKPLLLVHLHALMNTASFS
jgi:hypothetical protein